MRLDYNKPRNAVLEPDGAAHISRIIRCAGDGCLRMILEYGQYAPETRHSHGVPETVEKVAIDAGAVVVQALCDHCGGQAYERYGPVKRVAN